MALKGEQRQILNEILRVGSTIKDPAKRRRYTRAAVQTGLVESNLRNLSYGDADSKGWRQERTSIYGQDATNVRASVRRFFNEAKQLDRGQPSWQLAADVQRPAAQYRGRYRDVANQAEKLIGGQGGVRAGASSSGGGGRTAEHVKFDPGVATLTALQQISNAREQPQVTAPAMPAFAAKVALPTGYQAPDTAGVPQERQSLSGALEQIAALSPSSIGTATTGGKRIGGGRGGRGGGGGGRGGGGTGSIHELFWRGPGAVNIDEGKRVGTDFVTGHTDHVHLAADRRTMQRAQRKAKQLGLTVGEYGPSISAGHATNSFHYRPYGAMDVSGDTAKMRRFANLVSKGRI